MIDQQNIVNEVRSKVDIVDIISERIPLIQKGKNFFGVCPFHDDTNPSMCVSREKQIFTCFSCHATGNVYRFIMDYEHINFREALQLLALKAGISVANIKTQTKPNRYDKYYDIYKLALKYYQNNLNTNYGKKARDYLVNRQLDNKVIKEFEIGLSLTNKQDLTKLLIKKGYDYQTLNQIGLSNNDNDIYIDRIIFPLYDINGRVVGFSGRIYDDSHLNKYLNTKETPIFKKGLTLYHYHVAKEEARIKKSVIVTEGFMDVIRLSTIGIRNTVALMGTALTNEQANLLKRLSPNIILCLDGDGPGKKATLAIGQHLLQLGIEPKVIALDGDYDPDTYILTFGKERFESLIEKAMHFRDYKMKTLKEKVNLSSDEEKTAYIHQALEEISQINDEIHREMMLKNLAKEFNIGYNTLEKHLKDLLSKQPSNNNTLIPSKRNIPKYSKYQKAMFAIIYYMLVDNDVIRQFEKEKLYLPDETCRFLASEISYYYKKYGTIVLADFYTYIEDKKELLSLLNQIVAISFVEKVPMSVILDYFAVIKDYNKKLEVKRLQSMIEKETDPLQQAKIAERIRKLRVGS